jgi:hypothetical protein
MLQVRGRGGDGSERGTKIQIEYNEPWESGRNRDGGERERERKEEGEMGRDRAVRELGREGGERTMREWQGRRERAGRHQHCTWGKKISSRERHIDLLSYNDTQTFTIFPQCCRVGMATAPLWCGNRNPSPQSRPHDRLGRGERCGSRLD